MSTKRWVVMLSVVLFGTTALAQGPDKKTERLWKSKCSSCHGAEGKADTKKGAEMKIRDMSSAEYQAKLKDEDIKKSMLEGVNRTEGGVKQEMESFQDTLKPEQVDALVAYVRSLKK